MLSPFAEEMYKIAVSKAMSSGPQSRKVRRPMTVSNYAKRGGDPERLHSIKQALGKVQAGMLAGAAGTLGAQTAYKDITVGHKVRSQQKRQMKAQRMMQRYGG